MYPNFSTGTILATVITMSSVVSAPPIELPRIVIVSVGVYPDPASAIVTDEIAPVPSLSTLNFALTPLADATPVTSL